MSKHHPMKMYGGEWSASLLQSKWRQNSTQGYKLWLWRLHQNTATVTLWGSRYIYL